MEEVLQDFPPLPIEGGMLLISCAFFVNAQFKFGILDLSTFYTPRSSMMHDGRNTCKIIGEFY